MMFLPATTWFNSYFANININSLTGDIVQEFRKIFSNPVITTYVIS